MGIGIKPNGMTSSASALRYWERRQEVAANNLANVSTPGFRGEKVFARMLEGALPEAQAATDRTPGTMTPTGGTLDLALDNDAFLVVDTPKGERLSRGGSFHLGEHGVVVDASGNPLLTEQGPLMVPEGTDHLTIDREGIVSTHDRPIGRLRVETVASGAALQHDGGSLWVAASGRTPASDDVRAVRQGFIEESNVNSVSSMVDLIDIQRSYASVQKAVVTLDQIRGLISNELGKPVG